MTVGRHTCTDPSKQGSCRHVKRQIEKRRSIPYWGIEKMKRERKESRERDGGKYIIEGMRF